MNMQLSIKDVDEDIFRNFKVESVREGLKIGKALTLAMEMFIEKKEEKPKMSVLNLKPKGWERAQREQVKKLTRCYIKK